MRIVTKEEVEADPGILDGKVFVYPTDTIYGIGCDARDDAAVTRVRELKGRPDAPFSVIAPSLDWIRQNCAVDEEAERWLARLPGPYTLILRMARTCVSSHAARETLGVRIPTHWMKDVVARLGIPIVTTSVNQSGKAPMASPADIDPSIKAGTDILIDAGELRGRPSAIVNLTKGEAMVRER